MQLLLLSVLELLQPYGSRLFPLRIGHLSLAKRAAPSEGASRIRRECLKVDTDLGSNVRRYVDLRPLSLLVLIPRLLVDLLIIRIIDQAVLGAESSRVRELDVAASDLLLDVFTERHDVEAAVASRAEHLLMR